MSITTKYKKLFEVQILHHYFLNTGTTHFEDLSSDKKLAKLNQYNVDDFLEIVPTTNTIQSLKNDRLKLIQTATGIMVVTPTSTLVPNSPANSIGSGKFVFGIFLRSSTFQNFSNLPLENEFDLLPAKNDVLSTYYFTNNAQNKVNGNLNLSAPVTSFIAAGNYKMGALVMFNNKTYEARQHIQNSPNPTAGNSGWQEIKTLGYATSSDNLRLRSPIFDYIFTAPNITANFTIEDQNGLPVKFRNDFLEIVDSITFQSTNDVMKKAINISNLAPGFYTLKVANNANTYTETQRFYYDAQLISTKPMGIIEINTQPAATDYKLLTAANQIKSPVYIIRFQNRFTKWKYLDKTDKSDVAVTGAGAPLPFTELGNIEIKFNNKTLPNPNPKVIRDSSTHWESEVVVDQALLSN